MNYGSGFEARSSENLLATCTVTGPGASGNTISPKLEIGLISRVEEVRKASEAILASCKEMLRSSTFSIFPPLRAIFGVAPELWGWRSGEGVCDCE